MAHFFCFVWVVFEASCHISRLTCPSVVSRGDSGAGCGGPGAVNYNFVSNIEVRSKLQMF